MMILTTNSQPLTTAKIITLSSLLLMSSNMMAEPVSAFAKAMQHVEKGQWQQAQSLLNYQLELAPEHHRARLELAMVMMQLENYQQANEHLLRLLDVKGLPDGVKFNIELMQNQISSKLSTIETKVDDKSTHNWQFTVGVAAGYDSNVRFSFGDYFLEDDPYSDGTYISLEDGTIAFFAPDGNVYTEDGSILDADELGIDFGPREQDTSYIEAKVRVEHSVSFANLNWQNTLLVQNADNKDFSDFDKGLYKWQSELSWQLSANSELYMEYQHRTSSRGGNTLLTSNAISLGYNRLSKYGNFGIYSQWMQRNFSDRETQRGNVSSFFYGFDNDTFTLGINWSKFFFDRRLLNKITLEYKDNKASDDFNYIGFSTKIASIYRLNDSWSLAGYFSYFNQDYDIPYSFDAEPITDKSYKFGVKLDYQFDSNKEVYFGIDRGFRDSDVYGDISSQKTNVKLGINVTF